MGGVQHPRFDTRLPSHRDITGVARGRGSGSGGAWLTLGSQTRGLHRVDTETRQDPWRALLLSNRMQEWPDRPKFVACMGTGSPRAFTFERSRSRLKSTQGGRPPRAGVAGLRHRYFQEAGSRACAEVRLGVAEEAEYRRRRLTPEVRCQGGDVMEASLVPDGGHENLPAGGH